MHLYSCPNCGANLFFENVGCLRCGAQVMLDPVGDRMLRLEGSAAAQPCANRARAGCNWAVAGSAPPGALCLSCASTRTIPDLDLSHNHEYWREAEAAKRWVLWGLMRLGWFGAEDPGPPPVFDMVAEETLGGPVSVTMGHAEGVITLNVSEADPARLALRKVELGEPYRTVMGHLRHELAHYLHWRLAQAPEFAQAFRALFGDERADYGAALAQHYQAPQPAGAQFISSYATAHPHEDWAETTAHVLHLLDIADSFDATGFRTAQGDGWAWDAYRAAAPEAVIERAVEIGLGMNHVNRAMGLGDLYPFVLADGVRRKLVFALQALRRG
ncbi:MAG: zinc-binding metallopeptidase family protein [Roseinatronobacter sp.]